MRMRILKCNKYINVVFCGLIATVVGVILPCSDSSRASALTYQDIINVQFTFNPVIRIDLSDSELLVSNLAPGAASDSNIITVSASTNASAGYQLSATVGAKGGTDALVNTLDNTKTFANLTTTKAGLVDFVDNTWGYSYCADTSANCGTGGTSSWVSGSVGETTAGYGGLPLDDNDDASLRGQGGVTLISTIGDGDNGSSVQFKIGAKAGANQVAGTYNNTINFYAVANPEPQHEPVECEAGKICYNVNSLGPTEGTMGMQTAPSIDGNEIVLLASNFSRTGYGFAGWNTEPDYSGEFYGPQETITTPVGTTANGLSLYAVWVKSEGSIQDTSKVASVCNRLTTAPTDGTANLSSVSALTDQRDNNTYAIAKLADGNCWMIENLRLDNTATLTLANTNNPLNDGTNVTLKHNYSDTETYNTLSPSQDPATTAWCDSDEASCDDQSMLYTGNTTSRATNPTSNYNANLYSYGNYYNWYSATAGRGTYGFDTNNNSVAGDLCPNGWHLPQGGNKTRIESDDDNDFWNLTVDALNNGTTPANYRSLKPYYSGDAEASPVDKKLRSYPNNFIYSGSVLSGSVYNRSTIGYFWSSTARDSGGAYILQLSSSYVYPGTLNFYKYIGRTVRCVASGV